MRNDVYGLHPQRSPFANQPIYESPSLHRNYAVYDTVERPLQPQVVVADVYDGGQQQYYTMSEPALTLPTVNCDSMDTSFDYGYNGETDESDI